MAPSSASATPTAYVRPLIMGVVNVTPDSFSDGGAWFAPGAAIAHAQQLVADGAAILDIGGESTRPGAVRPAEDEEWRRTIPVIRAVIDLGVPVSIDTMRSRVAAAAIEAGASIVNDVSGGLADPEMGRVVAQAGVDYVAMHWRGHSVDMQSRAVYGDIVAEVTAELQERVEALRAAGVAAERIILDPGFGFAKLAQHNWDLLRGLDVLVALGHRVLVGTSRKKFLGLVGRSAQTERPALERDTATAVTSAYAAEHGAWAVRVHDVRSTVDAFDVAEALAGWTS